MLVRHMLAVPCRAVLCHVSATTRRADLQEAVEHLRLTLDFDKDEKVRQTPNTKTPKPLTRNPEMDFDKDEKVRQTQDLNPKPIPYCLPWPSKTPPKGGLLSCT